MTNTPARVAPAPDLGHLLDPLDLSGRSRLVVAVSGGSDSLALLHIARDWLRIQAPQVSLIAATVDHALRTDSAAEAKGVARHCAVLGIAHRTLSWRHGGPVTGLAAKAREARYRLLGEAAEEAGTDIVLLGHTMDDQAETVAMRGARRPASGYERGAAGMAPATLHDGRTWLVRPLLGVRRAELRALLVQHGAGWIDDPSNSDPRYERVRTRVALRDDGGAVSALAAAAAEAGRRRSQLGERAALILARETHRHSPGLYRVSGALAETAREDEAELYAMRALLAAIGGREHLPEAERVREMLTALAGPAGAAATLARVALEARGGDLWLRRELRGLAEAPAEAETIWDGRFRIAHDLLPGATIGPIGPEEAARCLPDGSRLERAALAAEPVLLGGGGASDARPAAAPVAAPFARFLPGFDLPLAGAICNLIGAASPPPSPWRQHNEDFG